MEPVSLSTTILSSHWAAKEHPPLLALLMLAEHVLTSAKCAGRTSGELLHESDDWLLQVGACSSSNQAQP